MSFPSKFPSLCAEDTCCCLQVFSFKLRGAFNKMASLSADQLARGVITSSAGNHAQGLSLAAAKLVNTLLGHVACHICVQALTREHTTGCVGLCIVHESAEASGGWLSLCRICYPRQEWSGLHQTHVGLACAFSACRALGKSC